MNNNKMIPYLLESIIDYLLGLIILDLIIGGLIIVLVISSQYDLY